MTVQLITSGSVTASSSTDQYVVVQTGTLTDPTNLNIANAVVAGGGTLFVDGIADNLINSGGNIWVVNGGTTYGTTTINGTENVYNGTSMGSVLGSGATQNVYVGIPGEDAIGTIVENGGTQVVLDGHADHTTIQAGGVEQVTNNGSGVGGTSDDALVLAGGTLDVGYLGVDSNSLVYGNENIDGSGTANSVTVSSTGVLTVEPEGVAHNVFVKNGGSVVVQCGGGNITGEIEGTVSFDGLGGTLSLQSFTDADAIGSNFSVIMDNYASVTVGGNGATGATIHVTKNDVVSWPQEDVPPPSQVSLSASSRMDFTGSGTTINAGANSNMGISGSDNTVTCGAGDGIWIVGSDDKITAGAASSVYLSGNTATGATNKLTASQCYISLAADGRLDLSGSGDSVYSGSGSNFGVQGSGNSIFAGSGDGIWLGGNGTAGTTNDVVGSSIAVSLDASSHMDLTGSSDSVVSGANSIFSVFGQGNFITAGLYDWVWLGGNGAAGATETVVGSTISAYLNPLSRMDLRGSNDYISSGYGSNFGIAGSDDRIALGANDSVWLTSGQNNQITAGQNDYFYDGGSGSLVQISNSVGQIAIQNAANDPGIVIQLLAGVGGYTSGSGAFSALTSDGAGGEILSLGSSGSVHFLGDALLSASNFKIG